MKDERQMKKNKFTFLDRNVRKVGGGVESSNQGSSMRVCVPYPPNAKNRSDPQSEMPQSPIMLKSTCDGGFNSAVNDAYLHNYSQENSMPSMISPKVHSFHSAMPMMNTMMSPHPSFQYPPYGYGAPPFPPPPPPGLDFGPPSPGFQHRMDFRPIHSSSCIIDNNNII